MIRYTLDTIDTKNCQSNLILLYGDEVAERQLPLSKKEIERVKQLRAKDKAFIVAFDRLPYHLYVVGFDSEKKSSESQETLRRQAAKLLTVLLSDEAYEMAITGVGTLTEEIVAFIEGLTLSDYSFDRFKSKEAEHLKSISIDTSFLNQNELDELTNLWNRIFWCREWVNLPVANLNAETFADEIACVAGQLEDVSCTVMNKKQIESLRMGGLLAVNKGSVDEPRFIIVEYKPQSASDRQPIVLVGKGITYDTGGLNIKPDDYMQEMKSDMAGAATMASVVFAAADNKLPVHLIALLPMTDNRPGFNAYAADDVLTMYDGTTVEVVNTDAEGRLILADAIAFAAKNYQPKVIIDSATLTGAAVRAISTFGIAAMEQNASNELSMLKIVGEQVYERIVEFPMWKEYDKLIESEVADIRNCGSIPQAGTITAGKFLAHFAKDVPFIHLDIAGVAFFSKSQHYYRYGASGYGIRLLYAYLQMQ
ncbi:MAG: leucyl aminopeptidase family protein [Bacteroidales bacterium]|nr:leucyl aminopeptidase family protein [Bacteroidales bacterium]